MGKWTSIFSVRRRLLLGQCSYAFVRLRVQKLHLDMGLLAEAAFLEAEATPFLQPTRRIILLI
jgi:hypothetical protein